MEALKRILNAQKLHDNRAQATHDAVLGIQEVVKIDSTKAYLVHKQADRMFPLKTLNEV